MGMERVILHSDCNAFYATVECLEHPELADVPVAVAGDPELRHGIILAKNEKAKRAGVSTGEAIWQARQKAPGLVLLAPHYEKYARFSEAVRAIYGDYTDQIEPFGMDEAWLDITGSVGGFEQGVALANTIRERVRHELGITVSVGVSYNKVYAKLGSDYKKPDATTAITRENRQRIVYPLPVSDLLYVGRATGEKLRRRGVYTIGELAAVEPDMMYSWFGKTGMMLSAFARGEDTSPVARQNDCAPAKSIGNSTTTACDMCSDGDVKRTLYMLSEGVAARLRAEKCRCRVVELHVRDSRLRSFERQTTLERPTNLTDELAAAALTLFQRHYQWPCPVRSVGVRACELTAENCPEQLSLFFEDEQGRIKREAAERAADEVRARYGKRGVTRAITLEAGGLLDGPRNFFTAATRAQ